MAKTTPIGVRFDGELLEMLKEREVATSPQTALNYLQQHYQYSTKKIAELEARIALLEPMAATWQQRMQATVEAIKEAPNVVTTYSEQPKPQQPLMGIINDYKSRLSKCNSYDEVAKIMAEVEKDSRIGWKPKAEIREYAKSIRLDY